MNKHIVRALFQDALYQVLDNLGFRILGVVFLIPVLFTFLIGFKDDGIWLAHYWHLSYDDLLSALLVDSSGGTGGMKLPATIRQDALEAMTAFLVDWVADKAGCVFGIAAISFFVPQMLEKGAADVVFSKPVSRLSLLLSRYFGGLIFVGLLSVVLVGGMFVGFWVTSDYADTGLLWSVLTLMYGFAIFHAISCLLGVVTRSAIAALLLTTFFMPVNCAMHKLWEGGAVERYREAQREPAKSSASESSAAAQWIGRVWSAALTTYHVVAPKSRDATLIAQQLRRQVEDTLPEFEDSESGLSIAAAPTGFVRDQRSSLTRDGLTWIAAHPDGGGEARWTLERDELADVGTRASYVKRLRKELGVDSTRSDISSRYTERFDWTEKRGDEERTRRRWVFQVGSSILTLDYDAEAGWAALDESEHSAQVFLAGIEIQDEMQRREQLESYGEYFAWGGPWQFNAWFSVSTTLAFIVATLALAWWKLSRIDF